ncbi:MAG: hypothetical protein IK020_02395 [Clostridiales bacterium]|nr:hypothetical protein [Clostridiales bacterium]MBR5974011.1 hypothetical protein [Clostridiales bacterium]
MKSRSMITGQRSRYISLLIASSVFLSGTMMLTSCKKSEESSDGSVPSRSVKSSSIVTKAEESSSEVNGEDLKNSLSESDINGSEDSGSTASTTEPTWGGAPWNKPAEFDFDLSFSDDVKVVDYGRSTVNVYHAKYNEPMLYQNTVPKWNEGDWLFNDAHDILKWCKGEFVDNPWDTFEWSVLDREKALQNIHNVEVVPLVTLEDGTEVADRLNLPTDTQVLCWTYKVEGFPWQYFEDADWMKVPRDIQTTKYVLMDAQYVDGLPLHGDKSGYSSDTFEWEGVIEPSRLRTIYEYFMFSKPDCACTYEFSSNTYTITDTVKTDLPIVDPMTCLPEIREALTYNPSFGGSIPSEEQPCLIHVWETDIEVYLMELTYAVLETDPFNPDFEEAMLNLDEHEVTLVPVWEVYVTVADPKDERLLTTRKVMINAVTGESLYSDNWGPDENEELYPHMNEI